MRIPNCAHNAKATEQVSRETFGRFYTWTNLGEQPSTASETTFVRISANSPRTAEHVRIRSYQYFSVAVIATPKHPLDMSRSIPLYTFLCLSVAACSRATPDSSPPEPASVEAAPEDAAAPSERNTHDDEIFGVLDVIHDEAIAHAEFMKKWAKGQQVKDYAAAVVEEHESVRDRQKRTRDGLDLRTSGSRLADDLEQSSKQKLDTLREIEKGDPLDKAYIDTQVDVLAAWLGALDNQLIPFAQTPELRDELEQVRRLIEAQYSRAVELRASLSGDGAADRGDRDQ